MPLMTADDGVQLYYEEVGSGTPIIFVHEFAGDHRSWEPQLRHFARSYRCIAYNARGYPPSEVPEDGEKYSQDRARDDIRAVLDGLSIAKAHVVGLSMGGFATLHFGLQYPERALSLVVAGCGYGAQPGKREQFQEEVEQTAQRIASVGMENAAADYARGPTRVQFQNKDPRGWAEFAGMLAEHSSTGSSLTMRGVQKRRPSLYDPGLLMKRTIPSAGLVVLPNSGHTINLEEPDLFNQACEAFLHRVTAGRWALRDPRAMATKIL
jgi:pimeloyl-ACP methyl ester carboxylesterase